MTLMLLFVSSWVAILIWRAELLHQSKHLPRRQRKVARGNLKHRVTTTAEDELALLAHSFNQMSRPARRQS